MKVKVKWCLDGNKVDIPAEVKIPKDVEREYRKTNDPSEITDYLSDTYGWLVDGWCEI